MTKTLDLGCGDRPRNPFHADELFGVDVRSNLARTIRGADLVVEPIPFEDNSFDYVTGHDFVEHIPRIVYAPTRRYAFIEMMNEVYRVLKPGGLFLSLTPAFPHAVAYRDPTHVNFITDETFPLYFDDENRWASIYGFKGAFSMLIHEWRGPHILAVMKKVASPDLPVPARTNGRISVLIPVHNGERYLSRTLDSALAQTDPNFEVLCINDGSTDGSARILHEYAARDRRLRVINTPNNLGSSAKALNYAIPSMSGDYFAYSSQDDLFSVDWLHKMRARAVETGADAVIPDLVFYHDDASIQARSLVGLAGDRNAVLSGHNACLHSLDWSIAGNALWNARLLRQIGIEEFAANSDEYSTRRLFLECNKVAFSEGRFYYRQDNPNAVTKRFDPSTFDWPTTRLRVAQLLLENGFEPEIVQREIDRAVSDMGALKQMFDATRSRWSEADIERAAVGMKNFESRLRVEPVELDSRTLRFKPRKH